MKKRRETSSEDQIYISQCVNAVYERLCKVFGDDIGYISMCMFHEESEEESGKTKCWLNCNTDPEASNDTYTSFSGYLYDKKHPNYILGKDIQLGDILEFDYGLDGNTVTATIVGKVPGKVNAGIDLYYFTAPGLDDVQSCVIEPDDKVLVVGKAGEFA